MKKLVAIILLCCIFLNIVGYHIVFYFRQMEIKSEMKRLLLTQPDADLESRFVFSLNDKKSLDELEWEEDAEFRYHGEMYDVIEKKIVDGKMIIRCLNDSKETALIKKYEAINHDHNSRDKTATLLKFFDHSCILNSQATLSAAFKKNTSSLLFSDKINSNCKPEVLTPPPQL